MQTFLRIIHLTDLHFGDDWEDRNLTPGLEIHSPDVAIRLTEALERLQNEYPVANTRVLATGDLTTTGSEQGFYLACQFLRSRIAVGPTLQIGVNDAKALILPGNHDTWQDSHNIGLKSKTGTSSPYRYLPFNNVFATSAPDASPPLPAHEPYFPYRVVLHPENPRVLLYALDSTRIDLLPEMVGGPDGLDQHHYHYWACGYVDAEQLNSLSEMVISERAYKGKTIRLAAVHHPLAYQNTDPRRPDEIPTFKRALLNIRTVQRALGRLHFDAVLCGHQHKDFRNFIFPSLGATGSTPSPVHVFSGGSAIQREEPPARLVRHAGQMVADGIANVTINFLTASRAQRQRRRAEQTQQNEFCVYNFICEDVTEGIYKIEIWPHFYRPSEGPSVFKIKPEKPIFLHK